MSARSAQPDTAHARAIFTPARKLGLALTAVLYAGGAVAILAVVDDRTLRVATSLPWSLVATLLALSLVNYAVRAWRWVRFGDYLGFRVPAARNVVYYLSGFCLTSTPGKAGEAIRLWFLKTGHGIGYVRSLPLMLADRIVDMWAILLLALVSIAGFAEYHWQGAALGLLITASSIPVLFPLQFQPVLRWVHGCAPRRGRWIVRARRVLRVMSTLRSWRTYGLTLIPTVGGWLAECAALFLLLQHFGSDISLVNATFVFSFSIIVGAVSMLPGGLGSTEATLVILLRTLGVDLDQALAVTAIIRITTFWFAVLIGLLLMPAAFSAVRVAAKDVLRGEDNT